jgi:hypothetical protein
MGVVQIKGTSVFPDNASPYAKDLVARDMGRRGAAFFRASILLRESGGDPYVWRHELCVAAELALKSALLRRDFDSYWPKLRSYGHRLVDLADAASAAFGVSGPRGGGRSVGA